MSERGSGKRNIGVYISRLQIFKRAAWHSPFAWLLKAEGGSFHSGPARTV